MADENEQTPPPADPAVVTDPVADSDDQPPPTQPAPTPAPPLEALTRAQLAAIVEERGLPGLAKANKAEMVAAIREHNDALALKTKQDAGEGVDQPPPPDATGAALKQTPADVEAEQRYQLERIRNASTEGLQKQLAKPDLPEHLRLTIKGELELRERRAFERERTEKYSTQIQRFVVTKGGRYVTKEGYITEIPVGSLLTRDTHDLEHVAGQGIETKPAQGVELSENQLGQQVSTVV